MHIIACQPANKRFEWELEVLLTNIEEVCNLPVILLFTQEDLSVPAYLQGKYKNVTCYSFADERPKRNYISSVRPYLWSKFLETYPKMQEEDYFYIDSDIIFREMIDFNQCDFHAQKWLGSDCNNYLAPSYIRKFGEYHMDYMANLIGISREQANAFEGKSVGAQWIIAKPTKEFWEKVYRDSEGLHFLFAQLEYIYQKNDKEPEHLIQRWTADMWALLWNTAYFGIDVEVSAELDFCWPKNPIEEFFHKKILHNAGIKKTDEGYFYKGDFLDQTPLGMHHEVLQDKCTYEYVKAIEQVEFLAEKGVEDEN